METSTAVANERKICQQFTLAQKTHLLVLMANDLLSSLANCYVWVVKKTSVFIIIFFLTQQGNLNVNA